MKGFIDIFVLIVYLAIFATAVSPKAKTGSVIDKLGQLFTNSIKVAKS